MLPGRARTAVLGAIFAVGLALRLVHLGWGLPSALHPDEPRGVAETRVLASGRPELHRYEHPPLLKNLAVLALRGAALVAREPDPPPEMRVHLALRAVAAVAGALGVLTTFALAASLVGSGPALLAAAAQAVLPVAVFAGKYGVPDTLVAMLFELGLVLAIACLRRPTRGVWMTAGLVTGLAIGAKYGAVFLVGALLAAHLLARPRAPARRVLAWSALGLAVGLAASFPLLPWEWRDLLRGGTGELRHLYVAGHRGWRVSGASSLFAFHLVHTLLPAVGPLAIVAMLGGVAWLAARRDRAALVVLAAAAPYYVAAERAYLVPPAPERYALPLVGVWLAAASAGAAWLVARAPARLRPLAWTALAAALLAWPIARTTRLLSHQLPDTRSRMIAWIEASSPPGTPIWAEAPIELAGEPQGVSLRLLDDVSRAPRGALVLASSFAWQRWLDRPDQAPERTRAWESLFARGTLLHEEAEPEGRYLFQNPTVRLYRAP